MFAQGVCLILISRALSTDERTNQSLLKKAKIYEHLKYSSLFYLYKSCLKPEVRKREKKEIAFYRSFLPACKLIFDIGAYDGHKTEAFLYVADRVVSCEPDDQNFRMLQIRFRHKTRRVFIEHTAVGANTGTADIFIHHPGSAFNTLNEKFKIVTEGDDLQKWNEKIQFTNKKTVQLTRLSDLIRKYGRPDFIKIDVEGYELEVLKGLSQPVPYIVSSVYFRTSLSNWNKT